MPILRTLPTRCDTQNMTTWDGWAPNWGSAPDLWENQGQGLTVKKLRDAMEQMLVYRAGWADLPIRVELYDGTAARASLEVAEIGLWGQGDEPEAVVITVARM